jgi:3-hydroxyacyl-[acyl-carrier-protein] dehydratase
MEENGRNSMMLKDEFFTIKEVTEPASGKPETGAGGKSSKTYRLALNVSHPVFQAHFAGNPVMPGACITQMIKELTVDSSGIDFFISAVINMKFLHVINPLEHPEISVKLTNTPQEDGSLSVSALINDGDTIFSKAIVVFKPV